MAPKKRSAAMEQQISLYKNKLRPRKQVSTKLVQSPPTKLSLTKRMPTKKRQTAAQASAGSSRATSKTKERPAAPLSNKAKISSKKRKVDGKKVSSTTSRAKKNPGPPGLSDEESRKYTFKKPYPQQYSFPENIIYYAARNPSSPSGHLKLLQCCKALFRLSRILPVEKLFKEDCGSDDEDSDESDSDNSIDRKDENVWEANERSSFFSVLINLKNPFFKLWCHDKLSINAVSKQNLASSLVKHIHKCSLRSISLQKQHLSFGELQILVSGEKMDKVYFDEMIVKNDDGSVTAFEKIFEALCCRNMTIYLPDHSHGVTKITSGAITKILETPSYDVCLRLMNIPETFDFQSFIGFLKANMDKEKHTIDLEFADNLSITYKNHLEKYITEIIKLRNIYAHTLPIIRFRGQNDQAWNELEKMRYEKFNGILTKPGTDRVQRKIARMSVGRRRCYG